MARIDHARRGGGGGAAHFRVFVLALIVLAAVLGMTSLQSTGLHAQLHSRAAHEELRMATEGRAGGGAVAEKRLQEEAALEAADGLSVGGGQAAGGQAAGTRTFEHTFETTDGTDADTSLQAAEDAKRSVAAQPDEVNTTPGEKYHVVCSLGTGVYTEWQSRVSYYWYKKVKAECEAEKGADCPMGGYTRLLHGGKADAWMDEIPSVVVDPLPPELEKVAAGYVVLERPYGFKQWVDKFLDKVPENYIWMGEPDHLWLKAPPLWATPERPAAFPFFYIEPKKFKGIIDRFNPKGVPIEAFEPIGNSPVQIHRAQLAGIVNDWYRLSIAIKNDTEADREFGWVQEMYAWSIASATALDAPVRYQLHVEAQLQPPWDTKLTAENGKPAYQIHFTYGNDFNEKGEFTPGKVGYWHWDKRDWTDKYIPRNFPMPPAGCTNEAVKTLVSRVNEAANALPRWAELEGQLQAPAAPGDTAGAATAQQRRRLLGRRPEPAAAAERGRLPDVP